MMTILFSFIAIVVLFVGWVVFFGAPWVPSHKKDVERAFTKLYKLGKKDFVVDFGAGDGKVLAIAARKGARGMGIELNPLLALVAVLRLIAFKEMKVRVGNYLMVDLPTDTTIVYVFGDGRDITKVYKRVQSEANRLNKTIHLISYAFPVPKVKEDGFDGTGYLYKIKAEKK